jgi:hypothetical protein
LQIVAAVEGAAAAAAVVDAAAAAAAAVADSSQRSSDSMSHVYFLSVNLSVVRPSEAELVIATVIISPYSIHHFSIHSIARIRT